MIFVVKVFLMLTWWIYYILLGIVCLYGMLAQYVINKEEADNGS